MPLIWLSRTIPRQWKIAATGMVAIAVVHVAWVLSTAGTLERAEGIQATFALRYIATNLRTNLVYLLDPFSFFGAAIVVAAVLALWKQRQADAIPSFRFVYAQALSVLAVYLLFYAGNFEVNPRYSMQLAAPAAILAAAFMNGRRAILLISMALPYMHPFPVSAWEQTLAADHRISAAFASQIHRDDLVVSAQPEMFINHDRSAMNAVFAIEHQKTLEEEIRRRTVWYHAGARAGAADTADSKADRWVKSNFELHPIQSEEIGGMRIAYYQLLLKHIDGETGQRSALDGESDRSKRR